MNTPFSKSCLAIPFLLVCACSLLISCASVSVKDLSESAQSARGNPVGKPSHIYVVPFSVERTAIKESFARDKKGQLKFEARDLLSKALVADLSKNIAPASMGEPGRGSSSKVWVVSGRITRIAEGSRLLRMGFGLGMGGTKLTTEVEVRADSGPVFLRFATTGGSGAVPGAATNPAPFSSLPTALLHTKEGVTDDVQRTARMIVASLGQYMVQRGWIEPQEFAKPKMQKEPAR